MSNEEIIKRYVGAVIRGSIGVLPLLGPVIVELINVTIPNQRQERIEKLLNILASKVLDINSEELEKKFHSPNFIDVFEDVLHQSVRATSKERLEYLGSVIEYGLRQEVIEHIKIKRLLEILHEINDVEVILLQSYDFKNKEDRDFKLKHQTIFHCEVLADSDASAKEREEQAMLENYKNHLINLGLVGLVDLTSKSYYKSDLFLTQLGAMLLKTIGLEEDPIAVGKPVSSLTAIEIAGEGHQEIEKEMKQMKPKEDTFRKSESQKAQEDIEKLRRSNR